MSNEQTIDVLERLWAAIGDRLLANGPLDQAYAHAVMRECTDEVARLKEQDAAPATMSASAFKAVQEACAKVCEKEAGENLCNSVGLIRGNFGRELATAIRSLTPSSIPGLTVAGESGWISVSEKMPDDRIPVLVSGGVAIMCDGVWRTITGNEWPGREIAWQVTHWQPLPPPPALTTAPGKEER